MSKKNTFFTYNSADELDCYLNDLLGFYNKRALDDDKNKLPIWNKDIKEPLNKQCEQIFKDLRKDISKTYHIKLDKLESEIKKAIKPLFTRPSENKTNTFKIRYAGIITEGENMLKNEQNLWGDCIRPTLLDFANFVIGCVQFVLSVFIPSVRNYQGVFFSGPMMQTREEASDIWRKKMNDAKEGFCDIAVYSIKKINE